MSGIVLNVSYTLVYVILIRLLKIGTVNFIAQTKKLRMREFSHLAKSDRY